MLITLITIFDWLDFISEQNSMPNTEFSIIVESYVAPLILYLVSNLLIPWIIYVLSKWLEKSYLKSQWESSIINKNYVFILLNSIIIPIFNLTVIYQMMQNTNQNFFLSKLSNSTEFILWYLIQNTFLTNTISLIALPFYFKSKYKEWVYNNF